MLEARASLDSIQEALNHTVEANGRKLVIDPKGPLNFLRGYLYIKQNIVYFKRVYSPEITVNYNIRFNGRYEGVYIGPAYNSDGVVTKNDTYLLGEKYDYISSFAKAMMGMFYVEGTLVSVINYRKNSFYDFLTCEENKKYFSKILATFLLLSEGINVPLIKETADNGAYLMLRNEKINFRVFIPAPEEDENEGWYDARTVLDFFTKQAFKWHYQHFTPEETAQFQKGYFMYSPNFLLQAYIYEICDGYMLKEIITEFHVLLKEVVDGGSFSAPIAFEGEGKEDNNESGAKKYDCFEFTLKQKESFKTIYNRCFVEYTGVSEDIYCQIIKDFESLTSHNYKFPFSFINPTPCAVTMDCLSRESNEDGIETFTTVEPKRSFLNSVEMVIYSILCACFYDAETRKYNLNHLTNASSSLVRFFDMYPDPFNIIYNNEFYLNWSKVLTDLDDDDINYTINFRLPTKNKDTRNMLARGWLNTLRVIIKIAGLSLEELNLANFQEHLQGTAITDELIKHSLYCISRVLNGSSRNPNFQIKWIIEGKQMLFCNGNDIFGSIIIRFQIGYNVFKDLNVYNHMGRINVQIPGINGLLNIAYAKLPFNDAGTFIFSLVQNMMHFYSVETEGHVFLKTGDGIDIINAAEKTSNAIEKLVTWNRLFLCNFICINTKKNIVYAIFDYLIWWRHEELSVSPNTQKFLLQLVSNLVSNVSTSFFDDHIHLLNLVFLLDETLEHFPNITTRDNQPLMGLLPRFDDNLFYNRLQKLGKGYLMAKYAKFAIEKACAQHDILDETMLLSMVDYYAPKDHPWFGNSYEATSNDVDPRYRAPSHIGELICDLLSFLRLSLEDVNWFKVFKKDGEVFVDDLKIVEFLYEFYDFATFFNSKENFAWMSNDDHAGILYQIFIVLLKNQELFIERDGIEKFVEVCIICMKDEAHIKTMCDFILANHKNISQDVFGNILEGLRYPGWAFYQNSADLESKRKTISHLDFYKRFFTRLIETFKDGTAGKLELLTGGSRNNNGYFTRLIEYTSNCINSLDNNN